ncbi:hypothetical protein HO173_005560 [Letharia columbiana]|uniref:Uncharacterized protein n=1 Tax=Letharia columbiana TaxID=112416 RepID=A0A8H6FWX1_9LECA|nr:uncharacterized protein HO173_005560 [Letharia columbiana]KAF6236307.1 hypothetical protein HO173_005560 [Letharia columbiana]
MRNVSNVVPAGAEFFSSRQHVESEIRWRRKLHRELAQAHSLPTERPQTRDSVRFRIKDCPVATVPSKPSARSILSFHLPRYCNGTETSMMMSSLDKPGCGGFVRTWTDSCDTQQLLTDGEV